MFSVRFQTPPSLNRFLDCLKPAGRHHLFSAAAASVSNLVRRHIAADAPRRHVHALTDGAGASTGFMEKAARKTVFRADAQHGEVVIPSPGFGRAFHDVEIRPTRGAALTLPVAENVLIFAASASSETPCGKALQPLYDDFKKTAISYTRPPYETAVSRAYHLLSALETVKPLKPWLEKL